MSDEVKALMSNVAHLFKTKLPDVCTAHGIEGRCGECHRQGVERAKLERAFERIPKAYAWATKDASELAGRVQVKENLKTLLNDLPGLRRVVFVGPAGSGKTSLACASLRLAVDRKIDGLLVHSFKLASARAKMPLGEGEAPLVQRAMSAYLILLDDLGNERNTQLSAVPDVIFERHAELLPTWVTTAFSHQQIAEKYGDGIARRVFEGARIVTLGVA